MTYRDPADARPRGRDVVLVFLAPVLAAGVGLVVDVVAWVAGRSADEAPAPFWGAEGTASFGMFLALLVGAVVVPATVPVAHRWPRSAAVVRAVAIGAGSAALFGLVAWRFAQGPAGTDLAAVGVRSGLSWLPVALVGAALATWLAPIVARRRGAAWASPVVFLAVLVLAGVSGPTRLPGWAL